MHVYPDYYLWDQRTLVMLAPSHFDIQEYSLSLSLPLSHLCLWASSMLGKITQAVGTGPTSARHSKACDQEISSSGHLVCLVHSEARGGMVPKNCALWWRHDRKDNACILHPHAGRSSQPLVSYCRGRFNHTAVVLWYPKPHSKCTQNDNAMEAAMVDRLLDRDGTLHRRRQLRVQSSSMTTFKTSCMVHVIKLWVCTCTYNFKVHSGSWETIGGREQA